MYVRIEKAVYAQDFNLALPQILKALQSVSGTIREVVIQKGRFEPGTKERSIPQVVNESKPVPLEVADLLEKFRQRR